MVLIFGYVTLGNQMIRIIFQVSKQLSTFTRYKQDIEKTLELSTISKTELGENLNKLQRVSFSRHVKLLLKNKYLDRYASYF